MMKKLSIKALQVKSVRDCLKDMKIKGIEFIWIVFILVLNCFMS